MVGRCGRGVLLCGAAVLGASAIAGASERSQLLVARAQSAYHARDYARAEALFAENDLPYELGRTLVEHGSLLAETARAPEAEQRFSQAITLFRESGARADLERAEAFAAALRRHAES